MRVTYRNAGLNKGAEIQLTTEEAMNLLRDTEGDHVSRAAIRFMHELLPKIDRAILHGDSEAEEGAR